MNDQVEAQPRRRRTQAERSAETKAKLLEATIALLVEVGYAKTSTSDVADRAGLSRGAQVHHFPRKADLVGAAIGDLAARSSDYLRPRMKALPEGERRIELALKAIWEIYRSPLHAAYTELRVAARTDPEVRAVEKEMLATVVEPAFETFILALGGPATRTDRALHEKIEACIVFMRGLAATRDDRDDEWCERQLRFFSELIAPTVREARASPNAPAAAPRARSRSR